MPAAEAGNRLGMTRQRVAIQMAHLGTPRDLDSRAELGDELPGHATVTEPDEDGTFEIELEADDQEDAVQRVWDALAASGADDHLLILEHRDIPGHWRRRAGDERGRAG
ncbi:MAG: hypothetical protein QOG56_1864 [Solirubrobacteraceae bacterium]|jgi:hypothetical protein|nr:hypothetical protein [Solirubrobacteraceae bacterium]